MQKTKTDGEPINKLMVDIESLRGLLSCGTTTARKIAESANASIKIGKRRLYNVEKIKAYLAQMGA